MADGLNQDLRNHGHSFHSQEHNYSVMAEDVQEFMQQQKLEKCVLIGHSMYAFPYPDYLRGTVRLDCFPC